MKRKIGWLVLWIVLSTLTAIGIVFSEEKGCAVIAALAGALLAVFIEKVWRRFEDLWDTTDWKTSQRKLKRGGFINDNTIIRISFAYLYRIKVNGKYLLVANARNTRKYQPVGGVYKLLEDEKMVLKNMCHIMDDDKIAIDESSRNDYRLRMNNKYLRRFVRRFNSNKSCRERIDDVGREFKEELITPGILNWDEISYRYCGRFMTELRFEEHFQMYELLLFDVVELLPTPKQELDLIRLIEKDDERYCLATAEQISCLGVDIASGNLDEWIGDQTKATLQENEDQLIKMPGTGLSYGPVALK